MCSPYFFPSCSKYSVIILFTNEFSVLSSWCAIISKRSFFEIGNLNVSVWVSSFFIKYLVFYYSIIAFEHKCNIYTIGDSYMSIYTVIITSLYTSCLVFLTVGNKSEKSYLYVVSSTDCILQSVMSL